MRRFQALLALTLICKVCASSGWAQIPESFLRQAGMETAWKSQVQVPLVGRGLVSSHLWADMDAARQFAVVELSDRTIRIPADQLDRKGLPIGIEQAKSLAQEYAARLLGKSEGIEVVEVTVPHITLAMVTSDGLVQALDGETGKLIWSSTCGSPRAPAYPASVSPFGICVVHGEELYALDWKTGKHLYRTKLRNVAAISIVVCNDLAFVTDSSGRVQGYGLGTERTVPFTFVMPGRAVGTPVSFLNGQYAAIATDVGQVSVLAGGVQPTEWIRFQSSSVINGSLAAANDAIYVGTASGTLSKITIDERFGRIQWEYRIGQSISTPALVLGNTVFVASDSGDISAVDEATGESLWELPLMGAYRPIGKSENKVFFTTSAGELMAVDSGTGKLLSCSQPLSLSQTIVNTLNDRVYWVSEIGQVQCLRPVGGELPKMIQPLQPVEGGESQSGMEPGTSGATTPFQPGSTDPFAPTPAADPFGAGAAQPGTVDPFGGNGGGAAADPFGGGGAAGADPFGGGAGSDPFGSGAGGGDPFGTGGTDSGANEDPFGSNPF